MLDFFKELLGMSRKVQLMIHETEQELKEVLTQQREGRLKERVQALYWLKSQQVEQLQAMAKLLGRDTATLYRWFERYRDGGIKRLLELDYHQGGRPRALPEAVSQALRVRLQDPQGFTSYGAVQRWLADEYGLELQYKTVHRIVRYRLNATLKVARSHSPKQAADAVATFKKNSLYG
jgi:transposase